MTAPQPLQITRGATLDILWDWTNDGATPWLADGETIASFTVTPSSGLTIASSPAAPAQAAGIVTAWVSVPGTAPAGAQLSARCAITTSAGRVDTRKFELIVADR